MSWTASELKSQIREHAQQLGFVLCGVTPAIASPDYHKLVRWIELGYAGEMSYFRDRQTAYQHPDSILSGAKSIIALAYPYEIAPDSELAKGSGRLARYVWSGTDYHDVIHPKLKQICQLITEHVSDARARGVVDTAPLLEREVAQLAGLGWRGKNTLLLNKHLGSYFFLACVLVDIELPIDQPHQSDHCGTCTACLDACPTAAFPSPGVLDATRCISYWTIEHRGPIDPELRNEIGDWVFGCDVCQEVCPWNRKAANRKAANRSADENVHPPTRSLESLELTELFSLSDDQFRQRFRKSPLWRPRRRGILRNAAIVLGNQAHPVAVPALVQGLHDVESIVRGASAWALGRIVSQQSLEALQRRAPLEQEESVQQEIRAAMNRLPTA